MFKRAFTLVEVVLAMGIIVVALIGVFALMQIGLSNYREAVNSTITSSIGQQVLAQYLLADFANLAGLPPQTNHFDEQGLPLENAQSNNVIYQSVAEVLPGSVLEVDSGNLIRVRITATSPTQPNLKKVFTSMIARQDGKAQ